MSICGSPEHWRARQGKGWISAVCHLDEAMSQQGLHSGTERRAEQSQAMICNDHSGERGERGKVASFLPLLQSLAREGQYRETLVNLPCEKMDVFAVHL